jgi:hypothetical protein
MSQKKEKDPQEPLAAADGAVRAYTRSKNFVEEIMRENERLRYRVFHLQQDSPAPRRAGSARRASEISCAARSRDQGAVRALNRENEDFRQRYQEVEHRTENCSIYVGYQLPRLNEEAVVTIIQNPAQSRGRWVFGVWLLARDRGWSGERHHECDCSKAGRLPVERRRLARRRILVPARGRVAGQPRSCVRSSWRSARWGVWPSTGSLGRRGFTPRPNSRLLARARATLIGAARAALNGIRGDGRGAGAQAAKGQPAAVREQVAGARVNSPKAGPC